MNPSQVDEAAELAEQLHSKMFGGQEEVVEEEQHEEQVETPVVEDLNWEQKYKTLKGKYDAEVPRLHTDLKELKQMVFDRLNSSNLQQTVQEQPVQEEDKFAKFKEEYSEELYNAIKEIAQSVTEPLVKQTVTPVQQSVQNVEETQYRAAQNNFVNYLDNIVQGDWKSLWASPDERFLEFLSQPDPSGLYTYGDLVTLYNDNWDADRLAKVFNTYFGDTKPAPQVQRQNPQQSAMVAPARSTSHTAPDVSTSRIWTRDMINQFQIDDRRGKYNAEDSKAMWDDLLRATAENRIRG